MENWFPLFFNFIKFSALTNTQKLKKLNEIRPPFELEQNSPTLPLTNKPIKVHSSEVKAHVTPHVTRMSYVKVP